MRKTTILTFACALTASAVAYAQSKPAGEMPQDRAIISLRSPLRSDSSQPALTIDGLFFETAQGRTSLPAGLSTDSPAERQVTLPDGRMVKLSVKPQENNFIIQLTSQPDSDIVKWGLAVSASPDEHFTGLMERVVDGPQFASWVPGLQSALDLRGQQVEMILKPTTSVYAPFYISSRGYGVFVQGNWPGYFDFCKDDPQRVKIEFEGPSLQLKLYTANDPATLVREHALDAGPPFLPPPWMYSTWRWRDENTQRDTYYDGTKVTGPFNSEFMEDVLLMKAYGIPCGIYWLDRPWAPGQLGYDDFEIDAHRFPNFAESVRWLHQQNMQMFMWIGPFFQGKMADEALAKGYTLAGQLPTTNNYPLVDLTNPAAKVYWQDGVAKLLKQGVSGFKLDRSEEQIPESGPYKIFDGRSIRENRNAYPPMYLRATYDVAAQYRGNDFVLMARAAYNGSSPYGVFWGGDTLATQEGLRAVIIGGQRAAVMGYPNWGTDTCGYSGRLSEQELCARWLAFSAFTPIMEVGPTQNVAFWDLPRDPSYDATLIAIWRLYARLHQRLAGYSYQSAQAAHETGMPIIRPLILVDPQAPQAWSNWWTYMYGPDLLVSPIWEIGKRAQEVYLPAHQKWRDAWHQNKVYKGGRTVTVHSEPYQMPLFIRQGAQVDVGDLNQEWKDAQAAAQQKPDLKALDAGVKAWFDNLAHEAH